MAYETTGRLIGVLAALEKGSRTPQSNTRSAGRSALTCDNYTLDWGQANNFAATRQSTPQSARSIWTTYPGGREEVSSRRKKTGIQN